MALPPPPKPKLPGQRPHPTPNQKRKPKKPRAVSVAERVGEGSLSGPGIKAKFTRTSGNVIFEPHRSFPNDTPEIDIRGEADYRQSSVQQHDIYLAITGTLGSIKFDLFTDTGLKNGDVFLTDEVHRLVSLQRFPVPERRVVVDEPKAAPALPPLDLRRLQLAFGMTREDQDVLLAPLAEICKAAVGSMGDDTPPAALLDRLPRRLEDHFKLRFAQELINQTIR